MILNLIDFSFQHVHRKHVLVDLYHSDQQMYVRFERLPF